VFLQPAAGASLRCPFCKTVNVIDDKKSTGRMTPDRILEAAIDREHALGHLQGWAEGANIDVSQATLEMVFLPFWTFAVVGEISSPQVRRDPRQPGRDLSVDIARIATTLKPYPGAREYLAELGRAEPLIDRLPLGRSVCVPATRRLPGPLTEVARASTTITAVPFDPARMKGWPAEGYQVAPEEAATDARGEAVWWARQEFGSWFGGRESYDTSGLTVEDFDLLLIPLWIGFVPHGQSPRSACVHAVTGRVF
jgi:hypothetical protein